MKIYYEQAKRRKEFIDSGVFHYEPTGKSDYGSTYEQTYSKKNTTEEEAIVDFQNMFQDDYEPDENDA